ncbi:MAG TPA: hypothetical protein VGZ22_08625 [Isosphaeraceae bacterium]|jgi:hypothetical protein|nr:hypothetical protein [Isosphaeraceae bacterium]
MFNRSLTLGLLLALAAPALGQGSGPATMHEQRSTTAVLHWEGRTAVRSKVQHDSGSMLYFNLKRDGQTITRAQAGQAARFSPEMKEPGKYTVVLEVLLPNRKPSPSASPGSFHPISNVLELTIPASGLTRHVDPVQTRGADLEKKRDVGELGKAKSDLEGDHADCERCPSALAARLGGVLAGQDPHECKVDNPKSQGNAEVWAAKLKNDRVQIGRPRGETTRDVSSSPAPSKP